MERDQLINYITGSIDETEAAKVRTWITAHPENYREFAQLKNMYALAQTTGYSMNADKEYQIFQKKFRLYPRSKTRSLLYRCMKYAAIIVFSVLLGYGISWIYLSKDQAIGISVNEVVAPEGEISEITLNEGTSIWLNSGSLIRIPSGSDMNKREIYLTGEAYFKVSKNKNKPFYVYSGDICTKVLGTEFNINAYAENQNIETTLIEGSVEIMDKNSKSIARLKPGQQLLYISPDGKNRIDEIDTAPYKAWKDGQLVFRNKPLKEIRSKLERWYNVEIIFADPKVEEMRFSGTILKEKPFDLVLTAIKNTLPVSYKTDNRMTGKNKVLLYSNN
jgi:ferric-dicitrate binding protein FerR (iron transport regulator)